MKITVLGPGCAKCKQLYENAQEAVAEAGIDADVTKVEDLQEISRHNVLMTPAIIIDGKLKSSGKVIKPDQIRKWLTEIK